MPSSVAQVSAVTVAITPAKAASSAIGAPLNPYTSASAAPTPPLARV